MGAGVGSPGGRSWPARSRRHRPCTTADLILVVEDGRIVQRGKHDELLAAGGRYEELYRTQFANPGAEQGEPERQPLA